MRLQWHANTTLRHGHRGQQPSMRSSWPEPATSQNTSWNQKHWNQHRHQTPSCCVVTASNCLRLVCMKRVTPHMCSYATTTTVVLETDFGANTVFDLDPCNQQSGFHAVTLPEALLKSMPDLEVAHLMRLLYILYREGHRKRSSDHRFSLEPFLG